MMLAGHQMLSEAGYPPHARQGELVRVWDSPQRAELARGGKYTSAHRLARKRKVRREEVIDAGLGEQTSKCVARPDLLRHNLICGIVGAWHNVNVNGGCQLRQQNIQFLAERKGACEPLTCQM